MFLKPLRPGEIKGIERNNLIDLIREIIPGLGQDFRHTLDQLPWPLEVVSAIVPKFQRSKEGIIFQPMRLLVAELLKSNL